MKAGIEHGNALLPPPRTSGRLIIATDSSIPERDADPEPQPPKPEHFHGAGAARMCSGAGAWTGATPNAYLVPKKYRFFPRREYWEPEPETTEPGHFFGTGGAGTLTRLRSRSISTVKGSGMNASILAYPFQAGMRSRSLNTFS